MKVKELIERLKDFDPELEVMTPGYEGGIAELGIRGLDKIVRNVNTEWYYGPHEASSEGTEEVLICG